MDGEEIYCDSHRQEMDHSVCVYVCVCVHENFKKFKAEKEENSKNICSPYNKGLISLLKNLCDSIINC